MKFPLLVIKTLIGSFILSASLAYGDTFNYTYTFGNGLLVTGSFDGTANGNLITDITAPSVFFNGQTIDFGTGIIAEGLPPGGQGQAVVGLAQASFDGTKNNFLFISKFQVPGGYTSNYFWFNDFTFGNQNLVIVTAEVFPNSLGGDSTLRPGSWIVTAASSARVPDNGETISLLGAALIGLAAFRRRLGY